MACKGKDKGACKDDFCKVNEKLKAKGKEPKAGCCAPKKDGEAPKCCGPKK